MSNNIYEKDAIILAPLSGFTDLAYRRSARRHGCFYAFTEMIDAGALVFGNEKTLKMSKRGEDEPWLGVQIVGSDHDTLKKAVKILNKGDYQVLDFNLGCPAPKVVRKNEGSKLAEDIPRAVEAFKVIADNAELPVSAKIRILSEEDIEPTLQLATQLEQAGAQAITIHGRIRKNFYAGPVFSDIIKTIKETLKIGVIANGGVHNYSDYMNLKTSTSCDKIMLARGAMGNPWIFSELTDQNYIPPSPIEIADEIETHVLDMVDFYGLKLGLTISRKVILDYMSGRGFPRILKTEVVKIADKEDLRRFTNKLREGPSERYKIWLKTNPALKRQMTINTEQNSTDKIILNKNIT